MAQTSSCQISFALRDVAVTVAACWVKSEGAADMGIARLFLVDSEAVLFHRPLADHHKIAVPQRVCPTEHRQGMQTVSLCMCPALRRAAEALCARAVVTTAVLP